MYPKEAWKFKMWSDAMLRGATVGNPEYKGKQVSSTTSKSSKTRRRSRRRRKKAKDA